jgi:hypothetical protein
MSEPYYTVKGKIDGFGSQYHAIISGIALCKYKNYRYVHTPFIELAHGVDVDRLNEFIGVKNENIITNEDEIIVERCANEIHWHNNPSIYYGFNSKI